ncbi:hypothetical protein Pla22_42150 [Rubripirellula amarantea]|uniref:Uncharacterized protein n=1 Tax=Rubripirellula amarantea TaxID=2527999 RepID=A0A5C5WLC9_9BACT|nr:hypothetical protein Pla22_42150 [Rubripirellula amarantea]
MIGSESHELMPSGLDLRGSLQRTGRCETEASEHDDYQW